MARILGAHRIAAAVVALALVLSGCAGGGGRKGPIELTFWSWVPGIDKSVALWNRTHPGVQVHLDQITAGADGGYAKMFSAVKAGSGPDVAQVEYWAIPAFVLEGGLVDLSKHGVRQYQNRFVPWQWNQGVFNGGVYAVPQASGPMALYYRADLFAKYGLKPPATWADYAKAAAVIKQKDPTASIGTFPPANSQWFISLAWQAGAHWFGAADKWSVDIDDPATQKVASYWDGLRRKGLVDTMPDVQTGWYKAVHDGKILAWVGPQWGDALLKGNAPNTAGKWRVAPMPQWDPKHEASSNWGGSSSAVLRGTTHPDEAMQFAVWLNTDRGSINDLIAGGYGWPAAAGALKGSALDHPDPFFGGQRYNDVFADADKHIDTGWRWIPTTMSLIDTLNTGFTNAITSPHGTFLGAVRTAQTTTVRDMRRKGLQVVAPPER
ncbi:MAG TPA: extracellular solute-binding protein [Streptosporangiaceae bacterium]|jgi:multiple sugar transport system substrate-binding protein